MSVHEKVNILMVDDQPAKLLSYEVMLGELGENLIRANSGREALELLLKNEVAVVLMDVSMPELDGFELAVSARRRGLHLGSCGSGIVAGQGVSICRAAPAGSPAGDAES